MITIINYGVGNINAFINIYKKYDIPVKIASQVGDLDTVDKLILPGVGSFDYAMQKLTDSGMRERLDDLVLKDKKKVLGICVGMQLMGLSSEEGVLDGLGWINGLVRKMDVTNIPHRSKLPHMGWNEVKPIIEHPLFRGLNTKEAFYFLHSYYFKVQNQQNCYAITEYGNNFASVIGLENIFGIQCHPEKSHQAGEIFLKNFAEL
jgi:imidazole glycerol-phosphate synthase subunit HisH